MNMAAEQFESEFKGPWPQVLREMLEFVRLTCSAHGRGRRCQVRALLAKPLVPINAVQPAVAEFCNLLMTEYRDLSCQPSFEDRPQHAVVVRFRN